MNPDSDDMYTEAIELALRKQLPERPSDVPTLESDPLELEVEYDTRPPARFTIPLLKTAYSSREVAEIRARVLAGIRGVKFVGMFETARCYVGQYAPVKR